MVILNIALFICVNLYESFLEKTLKILAETTVPKRSNVPKNDDELDEILFINIIIKLHI
jgi:hypothetical protein